MTVYTVFFVVSDGSMPDFDIAEFASLSEACAAASMMIKRKSKPCDAEIFADGRRIGVVPGADTAPLASRPAPVAQSALGPMQAAADLAAGMAIGDPEGLEMLAAELLVAGAACEDAFGWTPDFYSDVAAALRRMALRSRN